MVEYRSLPDTRGGLSRRYQALSIFRWILSVRFQRAYDPSGSVGRRHSDAKGVLPCVGTRRKVARRDAKPREVRSIVNREPGCRRKAVHGCKAAISWLARNRQVREWGQFLYDPATLRKSLELAGFKKITERRVDEKTDPVFAEAEIRTRDEGSDLWLINRWESMAFEAVR